ncbi:hypothetical protein PpBr36_08416 [Pyricularia pennisetigena]|uniref:hypothetical protein n=1 Tax=Pyricularia pennisetigena TaxID=1578925 RepID=UPI0011520749|nr:hypothetical protein PpBr36_08416 [Pyricularia pennisetigena]TLS23915.1 hypothetical protein PpBr36_08416 [Pyricularia pennisetigena]
MIEKGCEDIKVKAEMTGARDKAPTVHVAAQSRVSYFGHILSGTQVRGEYQIFNLRSIQYHRLGHTFLVSSTYQKSINVAPGLYVMYVVRRWNMRVKRGRL